MKVYVFGNPDVPNDNKALEAAEMLKSKVKDVEFIYVSPNEDLPFSEERKVVIMDVIQGIDKVKLIDLRDTDKLISPPRTSTHDFDLGFQLKYLKKLGKLKEIKIIGIPIKGRADYFIIQSILRKLVAQDMQGS